MDNAMLGTLAIISVLFLLFLAGSIVLIVEIIKDLLG